MSGHGGLGVAGLDGLGAAAVGGLGAADGLQGVGAAGLHGLGVAGGQHSPGDMAGTPVGAALTSRGNRRSNKKSRDDEVYYFLSRISFICCGSKFQQCFRESWIG